MQAAKQVSAQYEDDGKSSSLSQVTYDLISMVTYITGEKSGMSLLACLAL
jgi:hypothetical protein